MGGATWSVGHHGEVFGVTAPEAYVPHMMDQGYALEDDLGSLIGEEWGEGALGAEAFQEPTENNNDRAGSGNYMVPLVSQEQAYANHGLQMNQVAASIDDPGTTTPVPARETRWGPPGES